MKPIDSAATLAAASQMAPVGAQPVQPIAHLNAHDPSMDDLTRRFSSMMSSPQAGDHLPSGPQNVPTTQAIDNGEDFLKQIQASTYMGGRC